MLKEELEKTLTEEGKRFTPNVIDKVYSSLGIELSPEKKVERTLNLEGETFVPNVKPEVMAEVNQKNSFLRVLSRPVTLSAIAATLVAAIAVAVIVPNVIGKSIPAGDNTTSETSDSQGGGGEEVVSLKALSSVSMSVVSASETYKPSVIYTIDTDGMIKKENIVSLNDEGENVVENLETEFNRSAVSSYDISSFTGKYLSTSLNLGYIERQDTTKVNKILIELNYDAEDNEYFQSVVESLKEEVSSFVFENKVVASYVCNENEDEVEDCDSEIVSLIRVAYELATKLFVTADGKTAKVFCFSLDFNDWVAKYENSPKEELEKYVEFLKYIEAMISDDNMKALFMEDIIECSKYQEAIDEIYALHDEYRNKYREILSFFNSEFSQNRPDFSSDLKDRFDWWDDCGHNHHPHEDPRHSRPGHENPSGHYFYEELSEFERFKKETNLEYEFNNYQDMGDYELSDVLREIERVLSDLQEFNVSFNHVLIEAFNSLLMRLDNKEFFDENKPPHDNHYVPAPDGWEDDFDEWWSHHHF